MLSLRVLSFSGQETIEEIIEKISSSKADSLSLVFPRNADIFAQKTDLQRLRDFCEENNKEITIATLNAKARTEIQSIGIPCIPCISDKEETPFAKAREDFKKINISYIPIEMGVKKRKEEVKQKEKGIDPFFSKPTLHALFLLASIACLLFLFIIQIAIPGASVSIIPTKKEEEMFININFLDQTLYTEEDLWEKNNGIFMIPIESTFLHQSRFTNVSKEFHGENATGTIKLINKTDEDITLKKGTRIAHKDGLVILLPDWVKIPQQGNIIIGITMPSEDPYGTIVGERGNLPKGDALSIPGLSEEMQKEVYITVEQGFTGGVNKWEYKIAKKDFDRAADQWEKEAQKKVEAEISQLFTELEEQEEKEVRLVTLASEAVQFEVLEVSFTEDPESLIGIQQGYIDGEIKVRIKSYAYRTEYLLAYLYSKYQRIAPDGMTLIDINEDLLLSDIQKIAKEGTQIKADFSTRGIYEYELDTKSDKSRLFLLKTKQMIMGKDEEAAEDLLINNFPEIDEVEINLYPFWVRSFPLIPEKIYFDIQSSDSEFQ